jgi:hypothetical protein
MWHRLSSCAPRELWQTYRRFTKQSAVEPASTPDQQWEHWATQGDITEPVWTTCQKTRAEAWVEHL